MVSIAQIQVYSENSFKPLAYEFSVCMKRTEMRNIIIHRYPIIVLMILIAFKCSGCNGVDDGLVGITFQNGMECLGEDAQPAEGDNVYVSPEGHDHKDVAHREVPELPAR